MTIKVLVNNPNNEYINEINNIDDIKYCTDGRFLIHYTDKCKCCNQDIKMVYQIPKGYMIQIVD